jgi:hypothetical protein
MVLVTVSKTDKKVQRKTKIMFTILPPDDAQFEH